MKKHLFRSGFNLIEVTMAIAIVGIGIAGVMALFPPAIEASKNADFHNYTGIMVENVAVYVGYELKRDWSFKSNYKAKDDSGSTKPDDTKKTPDGWSVIDGFPGVYKSSEGKEDLLGIKSEDGSIAAHVRIWKEPNSNLSKGYFNGAGTGGAAAEEITLGDNYRIRLVFELSWPIAKAYADREKQEFIYEFNKPE